MAETMTRVRVDQFDIRAFIRNPFNIRRIAECPKCGVSKGERCRVSEAEGHKPEMYVHAERKHEAIRVAGIHIERLRVIEKANDQKYYRHRKMLEAAKTLDSIGVPWSANPSAALAIYAYAWKKGTVPDFLDTEIYAGQNYRNRNF